MTIGDVEEAAQKQRPDHLIRKCLSTAHTWSDRPTSPWLGQSSAPERCWTRLEDIGTVCLLSSLYNIYHHISSLYIIYHHILTRFALLRLEGTARHQHYVRRQAALHDHVPGGRQTRHLDEKLIFRISWPVALDQQPSWKLIWTVPPSTKETCRPEVRYIRQGRSDACQLLQPSCHAASCRSPPPPPRGSGTRPSPTGREDWRWPPGHHLMAWGLCRGVVRLLLNRFASGSWFGGEGAPEKGKRRAERTLACEEQCAGSTPWDLSRVWSSIELRSRQYLWQNQGVCQNSGSWKMSQICTKRIK